MTVHQPTREGTVVPPGTMRRINVTNEGSTRLPSDHLTNGLRHAAYGCWWTSVRASSADSDARDIRQLAAECLGVVDEIRALCAVAGGMECRPTFDAAMSTLATAKAEADAAAADEAMACWRRARAAFVIAGEEPSAEALTAVTREHHVAYEAMERAQAANDRASEGREGRRDHVVDDVRFDAPAVGRTIERARSDSRRWRNSTSSGDGRLICLMVVTAATTDGSALKGSFGATERARRVVTRFGSR